MLSEIYLELLDKCLLACRHCSTSASRQGEKILGIDTVRKVIAEAKALGAAHLTLSGGEPLLYPGIWDVLAYAQSQGFETTVYTSGIIASRSGPGPIAGGTSRKLSKYASKVITSLHGPNAATHDYITATPGSFALSLESIRCLAKHNLVEVHMVPMKTNYRSVGQVFALCARLGVNQVSLLRLVPQGRCLRNPQLLMSPAEYHSFRLLVESLEGDGLAIRKGAPFRCLFFAAAGSCSAGQDKVLIGPDGTVLPCEAFKFCRQGSNVKAMTLREIWQHDARLNLVRTARTAPIHHCSSCSHYAQCLGGCPGQRMLANGDMLAGPDPACLYQRRAQ